MDNKLSYSAVLVEYFSGDYIKNALRSLGEQTLKPEKIVVVVNGIEDSEKKELESEFTDVHFIYPSDNLGYAKAANLGIANTTTEIVAILNPDLVLDEKCSELACKFLSENSKVGAVGPKIFEKTGEHYPSARIDPSILVAFGHALLGMFSPNNRFTRKYKNLDADPDEQREVDWLSGAAQYLRRKALDEIGGWDEDFFMYCEDVDLGRRMRLNGWVNAYFPESSLTHVKGGSSGSAPIKLLFIHHKSLYKFSKKKYKNNPFMNIAAALFIAIRFPLALIANRFRIQ